MRNERLDKRWKIYIIYLMVTNFNVLIDLMLHYRELGNTIVENNLINDHESYENSNSNFWKKIFFITYPIPLDEETSLYNSGYWVDF